MTDIFDEIELATDEDETEQPERVLSMDPRQGIIRTKKFSPKEPKTEAAAPDAFDEVEVEQGDIFDEIEYTPDFSVGRLASQTGRSVMQGAADIARGLGAIEGQRDIEAETDLVHKAETGKAPSIVAALETPGMREARGRARAQYIEDMGGELHGWERDEGMRAAENAAMARESEGQQQAWEDLADKAPEMLPGRPEGAGGFVEDVFTGVARFAPSMAATAVAPPVGLATTGAQILGGKYSELVEQGVDEDRAFEAAAFAALTQTPIEYASNVLQIGAIKKLFGPGGGRLTQFVKTLAKNAATEGFEEILQQPFDEIADIYAKNPDKTIEQMVQIAKDNWKAIAGRTLYAGAVGATGGALLAGGGGAMAESARVASDWLKKKGDARQTVEETLSPEDREKSPREILTGKPDQGTPPDDQRDMNPPPEGLQPPKPEAGPKPKGPEAPPEAPTPPDESLDAEEAAAGFSDEELDAAANEAATSPKNDRSEPTDDQKVAGNFKKGHPKPELTRGLAVTIENPKGSTRTETKPKDAPDDWTPTWSTEMAHHYGYFKRSEGKDGEQIDVFLSDKPNEGKTFIIDQVDPETGEFDEHKVMMGFADEQAARDAYLANYEKGWKGLKAITEVTDEELKQFVGSGKRQTKAFATAKESVATAKAPAAQSEESAGPYAGQAFPHFTTPESKAALESGQPFDFSKTPIHGTGSLGAEAKTNRFAGSNRIYLSLEDETWSKTSRRVGTDQVVDVTADNANELEAKGAEFFYDYDAQAWKAKVGAKVETENLAPVSYRLAPDAKVLTIDSLEKLRAASRETGQPARDNPKFWDKLAKKYDAVALVNVRKIAKDTDSKFFQQALGDQIIVLNPDKAEVQRPEAPGGRVAPVRTTPSGETPALPTTQPAAAPEAPAIETTASDESVAGVLADPKATKAEVVEEKKKLKNQVIEGVKSGKYPVGGAVRFGTVDEIRAALKAGKLPVSEEYGEIHATPIMSQDDDVFAAYGAYDRHNMAMIIPAKYIKAKSDAHTKEVVVDEAVPLDELTFLIDGHEKAYTYDELKDGLRKAASDAKKPTDQTQPGMAQGEVSSSEDDIRQGREDGEQQFEGPGLPGKTGTTYLPDNTPLNFQYAIVDIDDLVASHDPDFRINPNFPAELQPRERDRAAMRGQVEAIANQLNPDRLGESASATSGAPMVANGAVVISGNGRSIAIRMAYERGRGYRYAEWVRANAAKFGIDADALTKIRHPVLVRFITDSNTDLKKLAREANKDETGRMSPSEQAKADAENLDDADLDTFAPGPEGQLGVASNHDFIRRFIQKIGISEAGGYLTDEGLYNKALLDRIQGAIFWKAYGNDKLLKMVTEDADPDVRNLLRALVVASGPVARTKLVDPKMGGSGLIDRIVEAALLIQKSRAKGEKLDTILRQGGLFEAPHNPVSVTLAKFFDENIRSGKRIGDALRHMANRLRNALLDQKQQGLFGGPKKLPTAVELVQGGIDFAKGEEPAETETRPEKAPEPAEPETPKKITDDEAYALFDEMQQLMQKLPSNIGKAKQEGKLSENQRKHLARIEEIEKLLPYDSPEYKKASEKWREGYEERLEQWRKDNIEKARQKLKEKGWNEGDEVEFYVAPAILGAAPTHYKGTIKIGKDGKLYVEARDQINGGRAKHLDLFKNPWRHIAEGQPKKPEKVSDRPASDIGNLTPEEFDQVLDEALGPEKSKTEGTAPADDEARGELWWSKLTDFGRRQALKDAGIGRLPDRVLWKHISDANRKKLLGVMKREVAQAPAATAPPTAAELAGKAKKEIGDAVKHTYAGFDALFGSPNKLSSGLTFDEDTYAKAKPHFEAALKSALEAGHTLADLVRHLAERYGEAIRPYLRRFYADKADEAKATTGDQAQEINEEAFSRLADWIRERLKAKKKITWQQLFAEADKAFGGTQAQGVYSPKDAYDAMELGVNRFLLEDQLAISPTSDLPAHAAKQINDLTKFFSNIIPTQTKRTEEQDSLQQFSTPPPLAYLVNWVANINDQDTYLEPSAGVGGLAVFGKMAGADVVVNEISPRRAALLKTLGFGRVFSENAEQLNNILPADVKPTVVVMNPPFSSTGGRVATTNTKYGARHIEQALARLQDGGRLVAIVGRGMAMDRPTFAKWWEKIRAKHTVRANVGVSGNEYRKYGTTFDNQIIVIDKIKPAGDAIITGFVDSVADLPDLLKGVRDARPETDNRPAEQTTNQPPVPGTSPADESVSSSPTVVRPATTGARPGAEPGGRGPGIRGQVSASEREGAEGDRGEAGAGSGPLRPGQESDDGRNAGAAPLYSGGRGEGGGAAPELSLDQAETPLKPGELTDSIFETYRPAVVVKGAKPHPTPLVESSAMGAVQAPATSYVPNIPAKAVDSGAISDVQLEAVALAGASHEQVLDSGERRGFFIGDGTGVGKGREIGAVIWDNWRRGRKKAVWVSETFDLLKDAKRDLSATNGIGWDGGVDQLFHFGKVKPGQKIDRKTGILFTTYNTLRGSGRSSFSRVREDKSSTLRDLDIRINQMVDWLGPDFDGVIAFDESHNMANAAPERGSRGTKPPSGMALAGIMLQRRLPNARVLYVSATGATEVRNLVYASRLGLWGKGTEFRNEGQFVNSIASGGVAAMELVAGNLKAMGLYTARSLSYEDVQYSRITHELTDNQRAKYDELAGAWQIVLQNINEALGLTNAGSGARGAAMSQFWGAQQRFFNQIITTMQMPSAIKRIKQDLDDGHAVVLQLVNTDEAQQERSLAALEPGQDLEDLDMTPREALMGYLQNGFPVQEYEDYTDDHGNTVKRPVFDNEGKPVLNAEAVALREQMMATIASIKMPNGPLDYILEQLGVENTAEVTGRKRRVVVDLETGKKKIEARSAAKVGADVDAFMNDEKRILVFSGAGATGRSFHADMRAKNQRQRKHYLIQPGWRADRAVQGLGRTHRSNQKQAPEFILVETDLKGQKRFISSIARRLDQLGALTKGQRQTGSQGIFQARDNLESDYAHDALSNLIEEIAFDRHRISREEFERQSGLTILGDSGVYVPNIRQFLNRILSMKIEMQNEVFEAFSEKLDAIIDAHQEAGTLDVGIETIRGKSVKKAQEVEVYSDPKTGATARYLQIDVTNTNTMRVTFDQIEGREKEGYFRNIKSGRVWAALPSYSATDSAGNVISRHAIIAPNRSRQAINAEDLKNTEKWERLNPEQAGGLWDKEFAGLPKEITDRHHIITGALLPIWRKIKGPSRIFRLMTDEGEKIIGRVVHPDNLNETLVALDAATTGRTLDVAPGTVHSEVLGNGAQYSLDGGWRIVRSEVSGEDRIEIKGPEYDDLNFMRDIGAVIERIGWKTRFFVPTTEAGIDIIKKVLKEHPAIHKTGGRERLSADGQVVAESSIIASERQFGTIREKVGPYETILEKPAKIGLQLDLFNQQLPLSFGQKKAAATPKPSPPRISPEPAPTSASAASPVASKQKIPSTSLPGDARKVVARTTGNIWASGLVVRDMDDAASLLAFLRKDPQENAYLVAVDKDGRIIEIQQYGRGAKSAASVVALEATGRYLRHKDIRTVYFAHNHPSGDPEQSAEDVAILRRMSEILALRGVDLKGLIIGGTRYIEFSKAGYALGPHRIRPQIRKIQLPVVQRRMIEPKIVATTKSPIDHPNKAIPFIKSEYRDAKGFLLLDTKLRPVGFIKWPAGEKTREAAAEILARIEQTNAAATVVNLPDGSISRQDTAAFLSSLSDILQGSASIVEVINAGVSVSFTNPSLMKTITDYSQAQGRLLQEDPLFRRGAADNGKAIEWVEKIVDEIKLSWKNAPKTRVVQRQDELPDGILRKAKPGDIIDGVFWKDTVWLVADNLGTEAAVIDAILHESFGHFGFRRWGEENGLPKAKNLLRQIYMAKFAEVKRIAGDYEIDLSTWEGKEQAAEEWLAFEAQNNPESTWVDKAVRIIREWLRNLGLKLELSDGEIRAYLADMRRVVVEGAGGRQTMRAMDARMVEGGPGFKLLEEIKAYDDALHAHDYVGPRSRRKLTDQEKQVRKLAYGVKGGDPEAVVEVAGDMAKLIPGDKSKAVLIPIPGHTGETASTLAIADEIARMTGAKVRDVLKRQVGPSQRDQRVAGRRTLRPDEFGMVAAGEVGDAANVYFVDNVITSGATIRAARDAVGGGRGLVYAKSYAKGPRFLFAGIRGASHEGAMSLKAARKMKREGARRIDIWRKTGWWEIVPGQWSFEIDDSALEFDYDKIPDSIYDPRNIGIKIKDVVKHPALFKTYPEIGDAKIMNANMAGESASWMAGITEPLGTLTVNKAALPVEKAKSAVIHEIQHAVQQIEGFVSGSSPQTEQARMQKAGGRVDEQLAFDRYLSDTGEAEARLVERRLAMTPEERRAEPPWYTLEVMLRSEGLLKRGQKPEDVLISRKGRGRAASVSPDARFKKRPASEKAATSTAPDVGILPEEVEKRMAGARGVTPDSLMVRLKNTWANLKAERAHFPHLTSIEDKSLRSRLADILRIHQEIPETVKDKTIRAIFGFTEGLSHGEFEAYRKHIILSDIVRDINKGLLEGEKVPFGFENTNQVLEAYEQYQELARTNKKVGAALKKRNDFVNNLKRELVNAKLLKKEVLEDDDYFHHQVLMYWGEMRGLSTGSAEVRNKWRPWQAARKGSILDYNTEYVEAEFVAVHQQMAQLETYRTLKRIKRLADIYPSLKFEAKQENRRRVYDKVREEQGEGAEDPLKPFSVSIAMNTGNLVKMILGKKGPDQIPPSDADFDEMTEELREAWEEYRGMIADMDPEERPPFHFDHPKWFPYLSYLVRLGKAGSMQAAGIFKAIRGRDRFIQDFLGDDFVTFKDMIPEGYVQWKPDPGKSWFWTNSVADNILEKMIAGQVDPKDTEFRKILARGRDLIWIIPKGLADTLDNFKDAPETSTMGRISGGALRAWKQYILINPYSVVRYNLNNMSGDLDVVLAYNPKILKHTGAAAKDLMAWMKRRPLSARLQAEMDRARELGVIGSGWSVQEVEDLVKIHGMDNLTRHAVMDEPVNWWNPVKWPALYWQKSRDLTSMRENVLRLAAYRWFLENRNRSVYGASKPEEVAAIRDPEERAAKLARELLGDYGNISHTGQWMRRHLMPFYSWLEINAPRYVYMMRNSKYEDGGSPGRIVAVGAKKAVWSASKFALKASMLYGAIHLWNMLFFPDEEKELGESGRRQLHIIVGRRDDGSIMTVRFQGALSDAMSFFGLEDFPQDVKDVVEGSRTITEKVVDAGKALVNRLWHSIRPEIKMASDVSTGLSTYPDVFRPMPIRDRLEHVLRTFKLDSIYRAALDRPAPGKDSDSAVGRKVEHFLGDLRRMFVYDTDPGVQAYYDTRRMVFEWQAKQGDERAKLASPTNASNCLYWYKQAMRYGDLKAADHYLDLYYTKFNGTPKKMQASIRAAHPLSGIKKSQRYDFRRTLTPAQEEAVQRGIEWYRKVYGDG